MTKEMAHSGFASIPSEGSVLTGAAIASLDFTRASFHIGNINGALILHPDGRVETTGNLKPDALAALVIDIIKQQWPAAIGQAPSGYGSAAKALECNKKEHDHEG